MYCNVRYIVYYARKVAHATTGILSTLCCFGTMKALSDGDEVSSGDDLAAVGPSLPAGVLRAKGSAWAGEEMEIDRSRSESRGSRKGVVAAVDISQFQNTIVGQGYQARHVVRQRTATSLPHDSAMKIIDMSKPAKEKGNENQQAELRHTRNERSSDQSPATDLDPLRKFLQCKAMRDFRRELEKMR